MHKELAQVKAIFVFRVEGISQDFRVIFKNGGLVIDHQPAAHPFDQFWNRHRIAMTLILDELVIELSEDFAVSNIGCPMPHESSPILSNCERHFTNHQLESPEKPLTFCEVTPSNLEHSRHDIVKNQDMKRERNNSARRKGTGA